MFFVVAAAAPLGFAVGSTPLAIGRGGIGTAGMFLVVGAFLAIFAVGYTAMTRFVPNAGALSSYIAAGLGRPLGLGTAFVAVLAYAIAATGAIGPFAVFASQALTSITGISTPWEPWAFGALAAMGILGVLNVELNIRVLGIIMLVEVAVLVVLATGILAAGGAEGLSLQPFRPDAIVGGEIGVVLLVVFAAFAGFEATALFREEARDPVATVRKATFASIALIAVFQAFVTWAIIEAFGGAAVSVANEADRDVYPGRRAVHWCGLCRGDHASGCWKLVCIDPCLSQCHRPLSLCARPRSGDQPALCTPLSAHRLGLDCKPFSHRLQCRRSRLLCHARPRSLSRPLRRRQRTCRRQHTGHGNAHGGCGFAFFWRDRRGVSSWEGLIAPAISALALAAVVYFVLSNIPLFTGREGAINWMLPSINLAVLATGIARALWMRRHRSAAYLSIGHWGER